MQINTIVCKQMMVIPIEQYKWEIKEKGSIYEKILKSTNFSQKEKRIMKGSWHHISLLISLTSTEV